MELDDRPPSTVFLRPIGSPIALGFAGLVAASLVDSGLELGWFSQSEQTQVAIVLLAFAFPLQFAASMIAFAARDGGIGTGIGVLSGTWLTNALIFLATPSSARSHALGLFLLAAGGLLLGVAAAAATGKLVPAAVFAVEGLRFLLAGIYFLGGSEPWQDASGVVGLVVVALAGYAVLAAALEDERTRDVLPLGRRSAGLLSMQKPFADQMRGVEHEPGVRKQL